MDSIRITRNEMPDARKMLREFIGTGVPRIAARVLRRRIIERTDRGVDSSGRRFVKYSKAYAKYGRTDRNLQTNPVNLTVTAKMKTSLDYYNKLATTQGTGHALAVGKDENPRALGNQSLREWVGIHPSDKREIEKEIEGAWGMLRIGQPMPKYLIK